ncbi:hypothetical protein BXZ70DRAFT_647751 [Cristinia sonorae]|uniref:Uncharacterized protein n=1 Tax=Cristinia sonorae TaxID=1940300 RepID=A0A8K0UG37_9AGAR|nr:hypothetical protein BXZ70DRAFT_647751 [Cristinia sonorae]
MSPSHARPRPLARSYTKLYPVPQAQWVPRTSSADDRDGLYPFDPIAFRFVNPRDGKISTGVPLAYLDENVYPNAAGTVGDVIVDAGEKVFKDASRAYLRILWPGYEHVEFVTSVPLRGVGGRVTRGQLALFIVRTVKQYFTTLQSAHCLPTQKAWTVAPAGRWRVEDLVLVALHLVHGNTFQAEFKVDTE